MNLNNEKLSNVIIIFAKVLPERELISFVTKYYLNIVACISHDPIPLEVFADLFDAKIKFLRSRLEYRILHLRMNSLHFLKESATGEKKASWTVCSVAKLVFIQQVHTDQLKSIHGRTMGPRSRWRVQCGIEVS